MNPGLRKLTLTAHVATSIGWLGALAVFFAHAVACATSQNELVVRAASIMMSLTAWSVLLPLSIASLATGLVQALESGWGLLKHYWVLFKFVLTLVATVVLLLKLAPIGYLAAVAAEKSFSIEDLMGLRMSLVAHAAGGLLILLTAATLAIYKPRGMTWLGRRHATQAEVGLTTNMPTWVKLFAAIVVLLLLIVGLVLMGGEHGPGVHMRTRG